ncbi:hypothetical protein [Methylocella sp.]|jgi:hypothetical protein|uniref:hypothetical protein n=1 Tax=Methylocella sp. TaxID=1978226 RepID=UPI003C151BC3
MMTGFQKLALRKRNNQHHVKVRVETVPMERQRTKWERFKKAWGEVRFGLRIVILALAFYGLRRHGF